MQSQQAPPAASAHASKRPPPAIDDVLPTPLPTKRPCRIAYPRPDAKAPTKSNADVTVGISKQAVLKRKALEKLQNSTFIRDPKRWKNFDDKIVGIDPGAEVPDDPQLILWVKHSLCGSWKRMSMPYNTERFKKHVETCSSKFSTTAGGMKMLHKYGIMVQDMKTPTGTHCYASKSSFPKPLSWSLPCPGITEKDDACIGKYIERTFIQSAGGRDICKISQELFSDDFTELSSERRDIAQQKQIQTHRWSINHIWKCIHAIGEKPCQGIA